MAHRGRQNADDVLLVALASGKTATEAAELAGVGLRTVTRRVAEPGFRQRVAQLRAEMVQRAMGELTAGLNEAAATIRGLLKAEAENVRLNAAKAFFELAVKLRESVELEERLAALEERHGKEPHYDG